MGALCQQSSPQGVVLAVPSLSNTWQEAIASMLAVCHRKHCCDVLGQLLNSGAPTLEPHVLPTKSAGADMYMGKAVFTGRNEISVDGKLLRFRKAVIATGGRAKVPPIPGLSEAPYLTNATLFNLQSLPPRLVVLGGGPIGLEMAQAFCRFGSKVTVLEGLQRILGPEDADAAAVVHRTLEEEGVRLLTGIGVKCVEHSAGTPWPEIKISVTVPKQEDVEVIICDAFLISAGRAPNVEGLGLDAAGVDFKPGVGVHVNDDLTTSNPDIFAIGDVIDRPELRFTHVAGALAGG